MHLNWWKHIWVEPAVPCCLCQHVKSKRCLQRNNKSDRILYIYIYIYIYISLYFSAVRQSVDTHDDVIKWKQFPRYWLFLRGIHRSPLNSPCKGQWRGAVMFSLICVWINRTGKQWWGWWFETPSHPLWRHSNEKLARWLLHQLFAILLSCKDTCVLFIVTWLFSK